MTRIYTRSGDEGTTGLADGTRINKTSARIEAIGTVDECNAQLGVLISLSEDNQLNEAMQGIQHQLFDLGAMLASKQSDTSPNLIEKHHVERLEAEIDQLDRALPTLKQFILPGGSAATAQAHVVRAVCRRAERCTFKLAETETVPEVATQFLNRLSDYLFLVARTLAARPSDSSSGEIPWIPENKRR